METVFIHGANASKTSWNWAGSKINPHRRLTWGMLTNPQTNIRAMEAELPDKCILVGHSIFGLYAWHLANRNPNKVMHGVSIGTPFGGSIQASFWRMFNRDVPWLNMLSRMEPWTMQTRLLDPPVPWTNVITTHGFDLFGVGPNDGVVTVDSQRQICSKQKEITLNYGHNEVLQSPELIEIILDLVHQN